jgi:pSer/pThr/pTyr-binding forkhead associated (FHA) protein
MAKLTFLLEDGQEVIVPLSDRITIGRDETNDVVVDDERISGHHAELLQNTDGSIQIFDLKSTAGTFVNDQSVLTHTLLHGDRLAFGPLKAVLDLEGSFTTQKEDPKLSAAPFELEKEIPTVEIVHEKEIACLEVRKAKLLKDVETAEKALSDWQEQSEKARALHQERVEALLAEEKRLSPLKASVLEAQITHQKWLDSIHTLSIQIEDKTAALEKASKEQDQLIAEVDQLTAIIAATKKEVEDIQAEKGQQLALLQEARYENEQSETLLNSLRQEVTELEKRSQESQLLAAERDNQVKAAQEQLRQLGSHFNDLKETEQKLSQTLSNCKEAEVRHATVITDLTALESKLHRLEESLGRIQSKLSTETKRLAETRAHHAALEAKTLAQAFPEPEKSSLAKPETEAPPALVEAKPARMTQIVHIESPRRQVIPMKSERTRGKAL